jgi:hypothetical protein
MEKHAVVVAYESAGWKGVDLALSELGRAEKIGELNKLMIHLRWVEKDLAGMARVAEMAERLAGDSTAADVLGNWKAVCFNRAAFFWRGWKDEDLMVSAEMESTGARYARLNLELAVALGREGVPLGRAHWLVGAYDWAGGDRESAVASFDRAAELTVDGEDRREQMTCLAYTMAVKGEDFSGLLAELEGMEDGSFYAGQVRSAAEVYG